MFDGIKFISPPNGYQDLKVLGDGGGIPWDPLPIPLAPPGGIP
jgi:hypothetical protein